MSTVDPLKMCEYVFKQGVPKGQKCMRVVTPRDLTERFCCAHYRLKRAIATAVAEEPEEPEEPVVVEPEESVVSTLQEEIRQLKVVLARLLGRVQVLERGRDCESSESSEESEEED